MSHIHSAILSRRSARIGLLLFSALFIGYVSLGPHTAVSASKNLSAEEILESVNLGTKSGQQESGSAGTNSDAYSQGATGSSQAAGDMAQEGMDTIKKSIVQSANSEDVQTGFKAGMSVVGKAWEQLKGFWNVYIKPYADKYPLLFVIIIGIFLLRRLFGR